MSTISELKNQILTANALGRANLAEKDVVLDKNATTIDIMRGIKNIAGGSSGDSSGGLSLGTSSAAFNAVPIVTTRHMITIPTITNETEVNDG